MAPAVSISRTKPPPRQRRSAATDTETSSSGVASAAAAGAQPLAAKTAATDGAASEKAMKRILRQQLHRRLRQLCQKVAMLQSYPRSEESIRSLKLYEFIAHRDSSNRTNVI